jgi:hypothetical protein
MPTKSADEFITIRTPQTPEAVDVYQLALELVEHVHVMLEATVARFHLKDRLDRYTTQIVMRLARARAEIRPNRWRHYRDIVEHLTDVVAMLDVVERQQATSATDELDRARGLARRLVDALVVHAQLGPVKS